MTLPSMRIVSASDIERCADWCVGRFDAMASPCEVLVDATDAGLARELTALAAAEAWRIESAFSRYRTDNIIHAINNAHGRPVTVDAELSRMLDFAAHCYALSEGRFDITSGILRRVWHFDGSDNVPEHAAVQALLSRIGWHRVSWRNPVLTMPPDMEIDLGGIGKEYAVDRAMEIMRDATTVPVLLNFGGDLRCDRPPSSRPGWRVGVESSLVSGEPIDAITLSKGALTTSGDARRFLLMNGERLGHVLDPRTGWPAPGAPRSVTVQGATCTETGLLSTLAMLMGAQAECFLQAQGVVFWMQR